MLFSSSVAIGLIAAINQVSGIPHPPQNAIRPIKQIELGPRPYYLVDNMDDSPLKTKLDSCKDRNMKPSFFSFAHRGGGPLQFPEHSKESNMAGARMGAGVLECDAAFTNDLELVCRHSQCDLHTTTNIVTIPELNAKCTTPFKPASNGRPAEAKCCTSDVSLAEFKSLCAKMDGFNASATNPQDFLEGTPNWRTDLYATCATTMSLKEHIAMTKGLGLQFSPELKTPQVKMPYRGNYTQEKYAQQLIDTFKEAGIPASRVWPQSFLYNDLLYWLKAEPEFAKQTMYLDETGDAPGTLAGATGNLTRYKADGVKIVAPPLSYLVVSENGTIAPSEYAREAKKLGLKIITWSLERSGPIAGVHKNGDYFYDPIKNLVKKDGDIYRLVDVVARQVGVIAMFSDWSATVTYYANCFGIGI